MEFEVNVSFKFLSHLNILIRATKNEHVNLNNDNILSENFRQGRLQSHTGLNRDQNKDKDCNSNESWNKYSFSTARTT